MQLANAGQTAANPVPSATPTPSAVATAVPIVAPRDAPPVRATTRPIIPSYTATTPVPPENVWLGPSTTIAVPMTLHDNRPYVQALIDGHPATLIVDTGIVDTMVDPAALDDSSEARVSLQMGDLRFPKLSFIRVHSWPAAPGGAVTLPLRVLNGVPAVTAALDGQQTRWFALSTGMSPQVALEPSQRSALARNEHSIPYQEVSISGIDDGLLVRSHTLSLGGLSFNQPLVAVLSRGRFGKSDISGSLGAMLLSSLTVTIDEPSSTATIIAPPGSTLARIYQPSGIGLEMRHGIIVVRSVVPGTPADAHLRPGDEIVSINGLAPATLDFARSLLDGNPGAKVAINYRRWHIVHSVTLTLHVIV